MALDAIDLAKARAVPGDLIVPEIDAHAGDVDRLAAAWLIEDAVDVVDSVAAQGAVWEGYELRLVIAAGVYRPGEVDVDGYDTVVWC